MEQFVVWNKDKLKQLTLEEKEEWFDVYNFGLLEDRGYDNTLQNQKKYLPIIKEEYFKFLHEFTRTAYFCSYFLWVVDGKIVSMCRASSENGLFLEGLETHHLFYQKGYASKLLKQVLNYLKEQDYTVLFSRVRKDNEPSIMFHEKNGFQLYDQNENVFKYRYEIMDRPRYPINMLHMGFVSLFYGIPFHKDNNNRFYKQQLNKLYTDLVFTSFFVNAIVFLFYSYDMLGYASFFYTNFGLICYTNLLNVFRISKVQNKTYLNITFQYIIRSTILLFILMILSLIIVWIIR